MTITLRGNKSQALTFNELDGNFTDLNGRTTTLEGAVVKTINGVSPSSNAVTITTANITENTNLYYTDARSRAAISVTDAGGDGSLAYNSSTGVITYTGPSAVEVRAHISVTDAGGDGSLAYNSTSGVITYTGPSLAEVQARINAISIAQLLDVNSTTMASPVNGHGLVYNSGSAKIELAELPGAAGGEANQGSNVGGFNEVFQGKAGVEFKFRTIDHGDNLTITQSTNALTIGLVSSPEFGNLKINSSANTIENISTNANIELKPNGTGIVNVSGALTASGAITGTLATAAQTNVTSLGTLTGLTSAALIVTGQTDLAQLRITGNKIESDVSNADLTLDANGTGGINVSSNKIINVADPTANQHASTKKYVDDSIAAISTTSIIAADTSVAITDTGANGTVLTKIDNTTRITTVAASTTFAHPVAMGTNKITGVGDPGAAQDAATKAYVDTQVSAVSTTAISQGNSNVTVVDSGTGNITIEVDGADRITSLAATTTTATGHSLVIGAASTTVGGQIKFLEGTDNGTNGVTLTGAAATADVAVVLPSTAGTLALQNEDTTGTAAIATTVTVADESSDTTCFPAFVTGATGNLGVKTDSVLTYNAGTGALAATSVAGDGSGLTALNGSNISSGTVAAARVATLNQNTTGTAAIATTITVGDEGTDTTCFPTFVTAATGNLGAKTDSVLTYNSTNGTLGATTFSGVSTSAQYADLAEKYTTDESYLPGTVMTVGGDAETTSADENTQYIAGVISTDPAYLMNSGADGQAIALVGRVPVRVVGNITKGQPVFATANGVASATGTGPIVGIALETNSNLDEKSIECMLKV